MEVLCFCGFCNACFDEEVVYFGWVCCCEVVPCIGSATSEDGAFEVPFGAVDERVIGGGSASRFAP